MSSDLAAYSLPDSLVVRGANVSTKAGLVVLLVFALMFPDAANLRDKAAGLRAVLYPLLAFTVPFLWFLLWRERASFPWLADLLVTITCFTDILGNRMDLYDSIVWFDDWMHFMNTGLLAAAVILLTMHRTTGAPGGARARTGLRRHRRPALGARGVLRLHQVLPRASQRLRGHPRRPDARHPRAPRRRPRHPSALDPRPSGRGSTLSSTAIFSSPPPPRAPGVLPARGAAAPRPRSRATAGSPARPPSW